jgi:hypothetical protein
MASGLGTATLDFGSGPSVEASVAVIGQAEITADSRIEAFVMARNTPDNGVVDHNFAAVSLRLICSDPTPGVGFTITAFNLFGYATGQFSIEWTWSD